MCIRERLPLFLNESYLLLFQLCTSVECNVENYICCNRTPNTELMNTVQQMPWTGVMYTVYTVNIRAAASE